jgi:hypothetical protein
MGAVPGAVVDSPPVAASYRAGEGQCEQQGNGDADRLPADAQLAHLDDRVESELDQPQWQHRDQFRAATVVARAIRDAA